MSHIVVKGSQLCTIVLYISIETRHGWNSLLLGWMWWVVFLCTEFEANKQIVKRGGSCYIRRDVWIIVHVNMPEICTTWEKNYTQVCGGEREALEDDLMGLFEN